MSASVRDDYLNAEVMTAAPQKLQLMLIEGAIRQAELGRECWRTDKLEDATEALIRSQQIVTELLCSLDPTQDSEVANKVAGIYLFVFRSLVAAQLERDEKKLDEALSVLRVERETWQQVCEKLGTTRQPGETPSETTSDGRHRASFEA